MSRRVRCIAFALACSALMVASSQAAPIRILPEEPTPAVGVLVSAWEWLVSVLREVTPQFQSKTADDTSHLDPNGNP